MFQLFLQSHLQDEP